MTFLHLKVFQCSFFVFLIGSTSPPRRRRRLSFQIAQFDTNWFVRPSGNEKCPRRYRSSTAAGDDIDAGNKRRGQREGRCWKEFRVSITPVKWNLLECWIWVMAVAGCCLDWNRREHLVVIGKYFSYWKRYLSMLRSHVSSPSSTSSP